VLIETPRFQRERITCRVRKSHRDAVNSAVPVITPAVLDPPARLSGKRCRSLPYLHIGN